MDEIADQKDVPWDSRSPNIRMPKERNIIEEVLSLAQQLEQERVNINEGSRSSIRC